MSAWDAMQQAWKHIWGCRRNTCWRHQVMHSECIKDVYRLHSHRGVNYQPWAIHFSTAMAAARAITTAKSLQYAGNFPLHRPRFVFTAGFMTNSGPLYQTYGCLRYLVSLCRVLYALGTWHRSTLPSRGVL